MTIKVRTIGISSMNCSTQKIMSFVIFSFVVAAAICCPSSACDASAPELALQDLHPCDSSHIRHGNCYAAFHRYCGKVTYPTAQLTVGVSRSELINGRVQTSCIRAHWKGDVRIAELSRFHGECNSPRKSQHRDCLSAIHGYCRNRFGQEFAGISQEVGSAHFHVGCFKATHKDTIPASVLRGFHRACVYPNSDSAACFAATSRFCTELHGYTGGITVEVANGKIGVACYNADYVGNTFLARTRDFFRARSQVVKVCSLELNATQGSIVDWNDEILESVTYDNRGSKEQFKSTLELSKDIAETSHFEYPPVPKYLPQAFVTAKIPFVTSGTISLSPYTSTFGSSQKSTVTKTYSHSSEVVVQPSTSISKSALITRAKLEVPWEAKVVTALGKIEKIKGRWSGESTYDFRITQKYN